MSGIEHLANDNIHELRPLFDVITDEYGNYYEIVRLATKGDKLTEVTLSHMYFEKAFSRVFITPDVEEYKYQHIGAYLQDVVNGHIESVKKKNRKMFSVQDLLDNGVEVSFMNQTVRHPRSNPITK